jgi:hypothetical protein
VIAKGIACLFHVRPDHDKRMPDPPAAESTVSPAPRSEAASKRRTLLNRSASTIFLVGLLAVALWFSERWIFLLLFSILSLGSLGEYFRLFPEAGFRRFRPLTFLVSGAYLGLLFSPPSQAKSRPSLSKARPLAFPETER